MLAYVSNPTFLLYGGSMLVAGLCALLSRQRVLVTLSALLAADWLAWNVTLAVWGFTHAPLLLPSEDVMWLGFAIILNRRALHNDLVRLVAYLFLVAIVAWGAFIATGEQNSYTAYLCANVVYLLQVFVVGGSAARWVITDRVAGRHWGGHLRPIGGGRAATVYALRSREE